MKSSEAAQFVTAYLQVALRDDRTHEQADADFAALSAGWDVPSWGHAEYGAVLGHFAALVKSVVEHASDGRVREWLDNLGKFDFSVMDG